MIVSVAVASPVRSCFDYHSVVSFAGEHPAPGCRVRVPFGRGTRVGVVMAQSDHSDVAPEKLKSVLEVIDDKPLIGADLLSLLSWTAEYYQHPIGDVVVNTLPSLLRKGAPARRSTVSTWSITDAGRAFDVDPLRKRAPRQAALLDKLRAAGQPLPREALAQPSAHWPKALATLIGKGLVVEQVREQLPSPVAVTDAERPTLTEAQTEAADAVSAQQHVFAPYVLDGVTGSGKTEVYLELIHRTLASGRQAMVLIPEIGLTPQTAQRFQRALNVPMSMLHSGMTDQQRLQAWLLARSGEADVVIGTRSAVFAPLARPGLFIVDEEHDLSYKQQDGLRYSARDLTVIRARRAGVPVVLGSATPSFESLNNVRHGRYKSLALPDRAPGAAKPSITIVDVRSKPFEDGIVATVEEALRDNLAARRQSLLFLNRRGYAPALICHACGWTADCPRCDAHMVFHQAQARLRCHHCGAEQRAPIECPACATTTLQILGVGTQRVVEGLQRRFPEARVARLDRDSTARKGALEQLLEDVREQRVDILVGTQMIAKGHDFPNVTLVAVLDADGGLFGADFRASERMAQLLVQVAGRAGRSQWAGRVLIQTHHPDHPLLQALLHHGYGPFAQAALHEREAAALPPAASLALLRAQAPERTAATQFLQAAADAGRALPSAGIELWGPVPAPMERRAGRYRAQLLVQCLHRGVLQRFLKSWVPQVEKLRQARRVRWSVDVDPQDMI